MDSSIKHLAGKPPALGQYAKAFAEKPDHRGRMLRELSDDDLEGAPAWGRWGHRKILLKALKRSGRRGSQPQDFQPAALWPPRAAELFQNVSAPPPSAAAPTEIQPRRSRPRATMAAPTSHGPENSSSPVSGSLVPPGCPSVPPGAAGSSTRPPQPPRRAAINPRPSVRFHAPPPHPGLCRDPNAIGSGNRRAPKRKARNFFSGNLPDDQHHLFPHVLIGIGGRAYLGGAADQCQNASSPFQGRPADEQAPANKRALEHQGLSRQEKETRAGAPAQSQAHSPRPECRRSRCRRCPPLPTATTTICFLAAWPGNGRLQGLALAFGFRQTGRESGNGAVGWCAGGGRVSMMLACHPQ